MKNITTYSARRTNPFVWLATLMMVASLVARIVFFAHAEAEGVLVVVVHILFPAAANLLIAIRLPWRGEKYFYVTVRPIVLLAIYFVFEIFSMNLPIAMTIACLAFCILQTALYVRTFKGKISSKLPVLLSYLAFILIAAVDNTFTGLSGMYFNSYLAGLMISNLMNVLGVIFIILSAKRLPDPVEGEAYRPRFGDRMDGRLIRSLTPMQKIIPYIMETRNTASNLISDSVEVSNMEKYIHQKRRDGYKHFGITHVFIAAYVRCCAEFPGLNRFIAGQKVYQRYTIDISMVAKKEMVSSSPDTCIKVHFNRDDTAVQVYEKFDEVLQSVKESQELDSNFDNLAAVLNLVPGLFMRLMFNLFKLIDYFGILPKELAELSPFHGSMFITSMGSLGIPPIFHHLYDFGNIPQFCAFGAKRTVRSMGPDGTEIVKKYVDYNWVTDERIVDGFYYAAVLKRMRSILAHSEQLDEVPEVIEDVE